MLSRSQSVSQEGKLKEVQLTLLRTTASRRARDLCSVALLYNRLSLWVLQRLSVVSFLPSNLLSC